VKYCPEKDADSYYGRAGSEPFNLKPPGPDARKCWPASSTANLLRSRKSIFACALFFILLRVFFGRRHLTSSFRGTNFRGAIFFEYFLLQSASR